MSLIQRIRQFFGGSQQNSPDNDIADEPDELGGLHPPATDEEMKEVNETLDEFQESLEQQVDDTPDHPAFGDAPTGQDPDGTVDVASDSAERNTPTDEVPEHPVFDQ